MAKRGRKPKEKKGYFYENEEEALNLYTKETDENKKNQLFNQILLPALTTMIESIIRRYKLFIPDEDFEESFNDTISYLLTKINNFRPIITSYDLLEDIKDIKDPFIQISESEFKLKQRNATEEDPVYIMVYFGDGKDTYEPIYKFYKKETHHYKAYSYCGTVCKNYLMFKSTQYQKKRDRNISFECVNEELINNLRYSTREYNNYDIAENLVNKMGDEIEEMICNYETHGLTENEIKVGKALVLLLKKWEEVLPNDGSNKLQKSSVLYFLREETMMSTKEVRDNMKKYKNIYKYIKKSCLEE